MITIKDFLECIQCHIVDGHDYMWQCYGPNARGMGYENGKYGSDEEVSISIVFDTKTHFVYEMQAWDGPNKRQYRWIHPDYLKAYKEESKARHLKWKESYDGNKFINLDVEEDILQKATAIFNGEDYDTRVMCELNLDKETLLLAMTMAHEADMTLNQYIEHILREEIKKHGIEV